MTSRRNFLKSLIGAALAGPTALLLPAPVPLPVPPPPPVGPRWVFGEVTLTARKIGVLVKVPNELFKMYTFNFEGEIALNSTPPATDAAA